MFSRSKTKTKTPKELAAESSPPPVRQSKRRLSLQTAIAAATHREGAEVSPLLSPMDEFPSVKTKSGKQQEMEAHLLELQAELIVREDQMSQREKRIGSREIELNEREALLIAKNKLVATKSSVPGQAVEASASNLSEEAKALKALQHELETQEASLQEARKMIHEREAFIEKCENDLVEKSMLLTEREARVEQDEEDSEAESGRTNLETVGE
jgi:hypothetical protein